MFQSLFISVGLHLLIVIGLAILSLFAPAQKPLKHVLSVSLVPGPPGIIGLPPGPAGPAGPDKQVAEARPVRTPAPERPGPKVQATPAATPRPILTPIVTPAPAPPAPTPAPPETKSTPAPKATPAPAPKKAAPEKKVIQPKEKADEKIVESEPTPKPTPTPAPEKGAADGTGESPTDASAPAATPNPGPTPPAVDMPAAIDPGILDSVSGAEATPSTAPSVSGPVGIEQTGGGGGGGGGGGDISSTYFAVMQARIRQNFNPPFYRAVVCRVSFKIQRDGTITDIRGVTSTGNPSLDQYAIKALTDTRRLPPLYDSFTGPFMDITVTFNFAQQ